MDLWSPSDSQDLGAKIVSRIKARTASGTGADGRAFKPYSKEYAAKNGQKVDLSKTGALLSGIKVVKADDGGLVIEVTGSAAKYAPYVHEQRPFLGLTTQEAEAFGRQMADEVVAAVAPSGGSGGAKVRGPVV